MAVGVPTGVVRPALVYHSTVLFAAPPVTVVFSDVKSIVAVPDPGALSQNHGVAFVTIGDGLIVIVAVAPAKHKVRLLITFA